MDLRNPRDRRRLFGRLIVAQAVLLFVAVIAYRLFGHRVVEAAYEGRAPGLLHRAIEGRDEVAVSLYLALADSRVSDLIALGLLAIAAQTLLYATWLRRKTLRPGSAGASAEPSERVAEDEAGGTAKEPALSPLKRAVFTGIVLLMPVLFAVVPYAWRYNQYMAEIEKPEGLEDGTYQPPEMPGLTAEQLLQVGKAHAGHKPPLRSYLNHAEAKPEGTIRVGVFGGSFTLGEEAAHEHDLSTHLERMLEEAGAGEVEVINFGVSGFGMSQSALLWEYIGRKYDFDYVVFMPWYFHVRRDNSFLHTSHHYGPLHGVHVSEGDSARYVPVVGRDRLDSCRRYFSPFQPLSYWRYDTRVPMLFRPLLPSPLDRRGNPFYYRRDDRAATVETYGHLFRKIASQCDHLVVFTDDELLPELRALREEGITVLSTGLDQFRDVSSSIYRAPLDHPSGIGYEVYATELAALLLGRERPVYRVADVEGPVFPPARRDTLAAIGGLSALGEAELSIAGAPVAEFRYRQRGEGRWGRVSERVDFATGGIVSLAVSPRDGAFVIVPLPFELQAGEEIAVAWSAGDHDVTVPVGRVTQADGFIGELSIDWDRLHGVAGGAYNGRADGGEEFGVIQMESREEVRDIRLVIGGKTALAGETRELRRRLLPGVLRKLFIGDPWVRTRSVLRPVVSRYLYFRGSYGHYVDTRGLPGEGTVDLSWRGVDGRSRSVPLLRYEIATVDGVPFEPPFPRPVATLPGTTTPVDPK